MTDKEINILIHAERLFAEKGFEGASTREISKAANVNVSMIAYYFGSKEKLLSKIFEYRMSESHSFANAVLENTELNAWEKLIQIVDLYVSRVERLRDFYLIMQREFLSVDSSSNYIHLQTSKKTFITIYKVLMEEGVKEGIFQPYPFVDYIHATISGTLFSALNSVQLYKEMYKGDADFEKTYFDNLKKHLKITLKNLLGYEDK